MEYVGSAFRRTSHGPAEAGPYVLQLRRDRFVKTALESPCLMSVRVASTIAACAAIAALVIGVVLGTYVAGGSDSSCYLNAARLLARGTCRPRAAARARRAVAARRTDVHSRRLQPVTRRSRVPRPDLLARIAAADGAVPHDCTSREFLVVPLLGSARRVAHLRPRTRHRSADDRRRGRRAARLQPDVSVSGRAADERRPRDGLVAAGDRPARSSARMDRAVRDWPVLRRRWRC